MDNEWELDAFEVAGPDRRPGPSSSSSSSSSDSDAETDEHGEPVLQPAGAQHPHTHRLPWMRGLRSDRLLRDSILQSHGAMPAAPAQRRAGQEQLQNQPQSAAAIGHQLLVQALRATAITVPVFSLLWEFLNSYEQGEARKVDPLVEHFLSPWSPWTAATKKVCAADAVCARIL